MILMVLAYSILCIITYTEYFAEMAIYVQDSNTNLPADEILSRKWDRCISNYVKKTALGTGVGIALSFLFFRRSAWPIAGSMGVGLGIASEQCSREFNPYVGINQEIKTTHL